MATNHVQDGKVLKLIAPTGGVVSGGIYVIGALVVIALVTAKKDEEFAAATDGVWRVPAAAGLAAGAASIAKILFFVFLVLALLSLLRGLIK